MITYQSFLLILCIFFQILNPKLEIKITTTSVPPDPLISRPALLVLGDFSSHMLLVKTSPPMAGLCVIHPDGFFSSWVFDPLVWMSWFYPTGHVATAHPQHIPIHCLWEDGLYLLYRLTVSECLHFHQVVSWEYLMSWIVIFFIPPPPYPEHSIVCSNKQACRQELALPFHLLFKHRDQVG